MTHDPIWRWRELRGTPPQYRSSRGPFILKALVGITLLLACIVTYVFYDAAALPFLISAGLLAIWWLVINMGDDLG